MIKILFYIFLALLPLIGSAQKAQVFPVSDCEGAINLFESGNYTLEFTGDNGKVNEQDAYPSLKDNLEENLIWISFLAPDHGVLRFHASIDENFVQMLIFGESKYDVCSQIKNGTAEIIRINIDKTQKETGLSDQVSDAFSYSLEMSEGKKIMIAFATIEKSKAKLHLDFQFEGENADRKLISETKILDSRSDEFAPTLTIIIKDSVTGLPITANIAIDGMKGLSGLYTASEVYLNTPKHGDIIINCDAEGYFFNDKEYDLTFGEDQTIEIKMVRIEKGKSISIEEIEFKPGTSEFMPGSEGKLKRLKDFLALNATVEIEIQGHVFELGDNSNAGQKLSEARAKRVMQYLVENGIDKNRMTAVGNGNTRPIYLEPKFAYEEQANRRVEILIK